MRSFKIGLLLCAVVFLNSCGLPTNQLTPAERKSDMGWVMSIFKHNYAPTALKEDNFGVKLADVETQCMELVTEDELDNQAFLALFQRCIHMFGDAHVGGQQMNSGLLPEYATVAHLGFLTVRARTNYINELGKVRTIDVLKITSHLKGSEQGAPLVPDDLIIKINDQYVREYLNTEIVPYINVGQDETNITLAARRFPLRTSIDMSLPVEEEVKIQFIRDGKTFDIVLPWIEEDMLSFQLKQKPPEENGVDGPQQPESLQDAIEQFEENSSLIQTYLPKESLSQPFIGFHQLKGLFDFLENPVSAVTRRVELIAQTGFRWVKFNPILSSLYNGDLDSELGAHYQLRSRIFPMAKGVVDLMANPLFTAQIITTQSDSRYAYIHISSFPAEDKVLDEWFRALTAIEDKGIKRLIIDLVDNNGGSLVHGTRMLNLLRKDLPLEYPSMQVRLNNNWMNAFKTQAAFGENDYIKSKSARVVRNLEEDMRNGLKISRPFSVTELDPFFLQNPSFGLKEDVKVALLVNELCISMCEVFASTFQDNNMGLVVGQRTMGGGGNVAQHGLSPISKLGLAVTESLILSPDGKFIEDNGVTPDIYVDMVSDRANGFAKAIEQALLGMSPIEGAGEIGPE